MVISCHCLFVGSNLKPKGFKSKCWFVLRNIVTCVDPCLKCSCWFGGQLFEGTENEKKQSTSQHGNEFRNSQNYEVHQTSTHHPRLRLLRDVCQFHFSAFSENECRVLENGVPTKSRQMCLIKVFSLVRNGLGCLFSMMRCNTCSVRNLDFFGQTCEMKGKEFGAIGMMYDDVAENHWAALVSHGLAETSKLKALRPLSDAYIYIFLCVRTYNT